MWNRIGALLAIVGTTLSICGTIINNLYLDHHLAMMIWMPSNLILLSWAIGHGRRYWDGGVSIDALVVMYAVFSLTNAYGLWFAP